MAAELTFAPTTENYTITGTRGGRLSLAEIQIVVSNSGDESMDWTAAVDNGTYVSIDNEGGTLDASEEDTLTITIDPSILGQDVGEYGDSVFIVNTTNGAGDAEISLSIVINGGRRRRLSPNRIL